MQNKVPAGLKGLGIVNNTNVQDIDFTDCKVCPSPFFNCILCRQVPMRVNFINRENGKKVDRNEQ